MSNERHYTTPEELLEINEGEPVKVDYERHYTTPEEYFTGPSDVQTLLSKKQSELRDRQLANKRVEKIMDRDEKFRKETEKYKDMPVGQKIHKVFSYYASVLSRSTDPSDVELSKKVVIALSEMSDKRNFEKVHELLGELSNRPETEEVLPHWTELVNQYEQLSNTYQNVQSFQNAKSEYKQNSWFNNLVTKLKTMTTNSIKKGK